MHYLSQQKYSKNNPNILTVKKKLKRIQKIDQNTWNGDKMPKMTKEDENS